MTSPSTDRWLKCISTAGNVRGVAIHATGLVNQIADMHGLSGIGAQALGEVLMGALMIGSYCKGGERINVNIRGSGHIQQALVDANPDGTTRGYVIVREGATLEPDRGIWGDGLLSILRTKTAEGQQPYIGTVPLLTGHLAKDFTFYWAQSEQIPSAVGLAVNLDPKGRVAAAAGFLVQAMPGASSAEIAVIDQHIKEIDSLAKAVNENADPLLLLSQIFQSTAFMVLEEKPLRFACTCSWERVQRALYLIGAHELKEMLKEKEDPFVRCDFCAKIYPVERSTIQEMIARLEQS